MHFLEPPHERTVGKKVFMEAAVGGQLGEGGLLGSSSLTALGDSFNCCSTLWGEEMGVGDKKRKGEWGEEGEEDEEGRHRDGVVKGDCIGNSQR